MADTHFTWEVKSNGMLMPTAQQFITPYSYTVIFISTDILCIDIWTGYLVTMVTCRLACIHCIPAFRQK